MIILKRVVPRGRDFEVKGNSVLIVCYELMLGGRDEWIISGKDGRQLYGGYWSNNHEIVYQLLLAGF